MSMELMVKAMKTKVGNPLRKLVLLKLADNANDQGECWPSYQYIADQCEISRSTVKNHIRDLEKAGLLKREFRKKGTLNQSNVFHLTLGQQITEVGQEMPEGGASDNLGGGASVAPRTSHSFEPVNESVNEPKDLMSDSDESNVPAVVEDSARFDAKAKGAMLAQAFDYFWSVYQHKTNRKAAQKSFLKIKLPSNQQDAFTKLQFVINQAQRWGDLYRNAPADQKQFQPNASTWINNERWNDEKLPMIRKNHATSDWASEMLDEERF